MAKVHANYALHIRRQSRDDVWYKNQAGYDGVIRRVRTYWIQTMCGTYAADEVHYRGSRTPKISKQACTRGVTCKNCKKAIAKARRIMA